MVSCQIFHGALPLAHSCFQLLPFLAQRVHRLPETLMAEGDQFAARRQSLQRTALPDGVVAVDAGL